MLRITEVNNLEQIYHYQRKFHSPYFFVADFVEWKKSFEEDIDGEGRTLFKELSAKAAYDGDNLIGFIQYGKSAFGFNEQGEISFDVSHNVIRNLYFDKEREDAGYLLLKEALDTFGAEEKVNAFFHYFGMSCFARHGKLFEKHTHIEELMKKNGFTTEHENMYYSSVLQGEEALEVEISPYKLTKGNQQYCDFILAGKTIGGCEMHFINDKTAYLRWIFVNDNIRGKGNGTKCMHALKHWLYQKGITRFDTDTAMSNLIARHYYEKNDFIREGITRSYYRL